MTTSETWVTRSIMVAPRLTIEVSFTPKTLMVIRKRTTPMDARVPATGDDLNGSQKRPRYGGMV